MTIERAKKILGLAVDEEPAKAWLLGYYEALWHRKNNKGFDDKCREGNAVQTLLLTDEDYRRELEAEAEREREKAERLSMFEDGYGRPLSNVELEMLFSAEAFGEMDSEEAEYEG